MTSTYELTVVYSPKLSELKQKKALKSLKALVAKHKGKLLKQDDWGMRPLAYPIAEQEEGYYAHWLVELDRKGPAAITEELRLDDKVLRYLIVESKIKEQKSKSKTPTKSKKINQAKGKAS